MTDQELNIKIAEKCGWKGIVPQFAIGYAPWRPVPYSQACMGDLDSVPQDPIPDYCNDLNAMHEAEKHIKDWPRYVKQVAKVIAGCPDATRAGGTIVNVAAAVLIHATARQRAEAFYRVMNTNTKEP